MAFKSVLKLLMSMSWIESVTLRFAPRKIELRSLWRSSKNKWAALQFHSHFGSAIMSAALLSAVLEPVDQITVAQSVEQETSNRKVVVSNPTTSGISFKKSKIYFFSVQTSVCQFDKEISYYFLGIVKDSLTMPWDSKRFKSNSPDRIKFTRVSAPLMKSQPNRKLFFKKHVWNSNHILMKE